jgi:flagellar motor protein MotB
LSADRAGAIGVLLEHRGVEADRITSVGFGAERPIVLDNAEIARTKNNRVELRVTSR